MTTSILKSIIAFCKQFFVPHNTFLIGFLACLMVATIAVRLMPHVPNFTPVGAVALFAGVYLQRKYWWGIFAPLVILVFSDLVIGTYEPKIMIAVYGSFLLYGLFGFFAAKKKSIATVSAATLGGAVSFYLVTNFAVWAFSTMYPKTLQGLVLSYEMALPFFKYMLVGDLVFVGLFFGAYELALSFMNKKQLVFNPITLFTQLYGRTTNSS